MAKKVAIIIRGVPSSGKSTLAKLMTAEDDDAVHSTNDYFLNEDGEYIFNRSLLAHYHKRNFEAFCRSLEEGKTLVVCDNTNHKRWEYKKYVEAAKRFGYYVAIVFMPHPDPEVAAKRSTHDVPQHVIERMIQDWEV